MSQILPIGIEDLLGGAAVETARLELKSGWDAKVTGPQVLETICAFANDLQNLNGGYVVLGVEEREGAAARPVRGLSASQLDEAQRWLAGNTSQLEPACAPVFSVETLDHRDLLVVWAPASDVRPHQAPSSRGKGKQYFVRIGSTTRVARNELLDRLIQQTARVPFDDRRAEAAETASIREGRVREFLHDVGSELQQLSDAREIYRRMFLVRRVNGHEVARNVALLFFADQPRLWFPGARVELVHFRGEAGGDVLEERYFEGPLHDQIRNCMAYLQPLAVQRVAKREDRIEAQRWSSYPLPALREAVVNALYHRGYEGSYPEPTKIYVYPDRIEVISYPGPVDGIEPGHFEAGASPPPVPARNRRIGELLKELRLAESRGTGVPKIRRVMSENGSPEPRFDFDSARTYFRVTLPEHPRQVARR